MITSDDFRNLIQRISGTHCASLGTMAIERAVQMRARQCSCPDLNHYWTLLHRSREEAQCLLEALLVPETWFFRNPESFETLAKLAREARRQIGTRRLRILSVPCSSGEEPYSIAMTLLDEGFAPEAFQIDALDISSRELNRARAGVYGKNSFRTKSLSFLNRYFRPEANNFVACDELRACVSFSHGNLLQLESGDRAGVYDFIFCRNLLIYFDAETQDRAVRVLVPMLRPEGVIFAGSSEMGIFLRNGLTAIRAPLSFTLRLQAVREERSRSSAQSESRSATSLPALVPLTREMRSAAISYDPAENNAVSGLLDLARRLADDQSFEQAERVCRDIIREHVANAEAHYLLGLIQEAQGDPGARDAYRRTLYLDPDHQEALLQLAFLQEQAGNSRAADALKTRARRAQLRSAGHNEPRSLPR